MSEYFFIPESEWLNFAEKLAGGPIICKDGVAMFDSLRVERKTNSAALFNLTMHMCNMVGAINVWNEFVREGIDKFIISKHREVETYDIPFNDWKNE